LRKVLLSLLLRIEIGGRNRRLNGPRLLARVPGWNTLSVDLRPQLAAALSLHSVKCQNKTTVPLSIAVGRVIT
jgi:hypothetical protein